MLQARVTLDRDFVVGEVDPRLFGGFTEHLGRCIYGGLYEPDHPTADEEGFRQDVIALVRELDMPVTRYPGGNFVSGYNWEDGVGPREQRPRRLDPAWATTEPNAFGTNEFVYWCRKANTAPMMAVNLGTRGAVEARDLVEYCNHPKGTALSDLRRRHGYEDPHDIKLWCLGNEMDGPWQMGHKTAREYGRTACEAAKLMKWVDPSIELVACGSSFRDMGSYGAWEREVLELTYDHVDYLSLHTYFGNRDDDTASFMSLPDTMSEFIEEVVAMCDTVAATGRKRRKMMLSFDEWNVWFHAATAPEEVGQEKWSEAPPILQDQYTMEDALVVGGMLISLLNHADRVKIGCIAQTVNVIAPIMTLNGGPAWRQSIFHPFAQASKWGRGTVLQPVVESPVYDCRARQGTPVLTAAPVWHPESGELVVFAVNRSLGESLELTLDLRAFGPMKAMGWSVLRDDDLKATNSVDAPERIAPRAKDGVEVDGAKVTAVLEPASWNVVRLGAA